ncbi:mitochondrial pyruvate carrier [Pilobolus umbonatus]|nr:mitochondrial pyruvate carrier [Pilobolus umbonatus]
MSTSLITRFINSPAGPKTIHFWAPTMKWGLVLAGLGDLSIPAENLSVKQNMSLAVSGLIWTRYGFVITPKNYMVAAVNFSVFLTGLIQLTRIYRHNPVPEQASVG